MVAPVSVSYSRPYDGVGIVWTTAFPEYGLPLMSIKALTEFLDATDPDLILGVSIDVGAWVHRDAYWAAVAANPEHSARWIGSMFNGLPGRWSIRSS